MTFNAYLATAMLIGSVYADDVPTSPKPKVGDAYEIVMDRETASTKGDVSSGSSSDVNAIVERVLAVREDGVELAINLADASAGDRTSQWQLPARFFAPFDGAPRLLNRGELEGRVDPSLKSGGMTRAACGRLIFTWNAFRIECDPECAVGIFATFDLQPRDLRDGALFVDRDANGTGRLVRSVSGSGGVTFPAEMAIDPSSIRRERARTDVSVEELSGKPVSLEAALRARAEEAITGTVKVTFEVDPMGQVIRRTRVIRYAVTSSGKQPETHTLTETLDRKRLA